MSQFSEKQLKDIMDVFDNALQKIEKSKIEETKLKLKLIDRARKNIDSIFFLDFIKEIHNNTFDDCSLALFAIAALKSGNKKSHVESYIKDDAKDLNFVKRLIASYSYEGAEVYPEFISDTSSKFNDLIKLTEEIMTKEEQTNLPKENSAKLYEVMLVYAEKPTKENLELLSDLLSARNDILDTIINSKKQNKEPER